MNRKTVAVLAVLLCAGMLVGDQAVRAGVSEDDLTVVKRAVAQATTPTPQLPPDDRPAPARSGGKPQWLRVRISERGGKRVRVNLPLAVVRALGDWPIDFGCGWEGERRRCKLRLSEVLEALDAGQSLVEVDDDGTTVRIWVE
jgi:hypothetical protein